MLFTRIIMENQNNSFFSKLMSFAFIAMGIFLCIYAFSTNASNWTLQWWMTWDNAGYLSWAFWDTTPSDYDIVTALYGTWDEGTAYTQNWSGYTSGSCLAAGMQVTFTGSIPTTIADHTIYVIDPGTYDVNAPIIMNDCSALISSGIVILSGNVGGSWTIFASEKNNFIIEKIRVDQGNYGNNGLMLEWWTNVTIKDFQAYNNVGGPTYALLFSGFSYGNILDSQLYSSANGLYINASSRINGQNIQSWNNRGNGISLSESSYVTLTGITSYGNFNRWLYISRSHHNNISHFTWYNNQTLWCMISYSYDNNLNNIDSYNNTDSNIYLDNTNNTTLTDIVANDSQNAMGLNIFASSGNTFSGVSAYGNYYAGVHLYNSSNNTGINIISNSNEGWLYMENSTGNNFSNITINSSIMNWVALFWSNNNSFSGLVSSGNMNRGIYMSTSDDNVLYNTKSSNNNRVWLLIEGWNNNTIENSTIRNNINNGIQFSYGNWNTIDMSTISLNNNHWIWLDHSQDNHILNSAIDANGYNGIQTYISNNTIISWCSLSWNMSLGIYLSESNNNIIQNSHYYFWWSETWKYSIFISDSTWTTIFQFSWNKDIYAFHQNGIFNDTLHDSYTKLNNYTRLYSYNSATLTWNTLSIWNTFVPYFDELKTIGSSSNYLHLSWVTSFTISWATWNGTVYVPTAITTGTKLASTGEAGTTNIAKFLNTTEVVSWSTYLTMNGGTGAIDFQVVSWTLGQYLSILRSIDGTTWTANTTQTWCVLDENLTCHFTTNGTLKLFAFGVPTSYSFTGTTQSWSIVTSGWYYNTWVRITFTGLDISWATLNGVPYISNTLIAGNSDYVFLLEDHGGNSTGITFTIDKSTPLFTGTTILNNYPVVSWGYYNENIVIDFSDAHLSWATLDGNSFSSSTTISSTWTHIFSVQDLAGNFTGMTFTIDKSSPTVTSISPTNGLHISWINNITFTRTWVDDMLISGYTLYITWTETYSGTVTGNTTTVPLMNGSYSWYLVVNDRAGNTWISQTSSFIITAPFSWSILLIWPMTKYIGTQRYTRNYAGIYIWANTPANYTITGAITAMITWSALPWWIANPLLTWSDGPKDIFVSLTDGSGSVITKNLLVYLDTVAATPTLTAPTSGSTVMGNITLNRSVGADAAGISWYQYFVSPTSTFGTIVASWSTTLPSVTITGNTITTTGTLYRYVTSIDRLGNSWSSAIQSFYYTGTLDTIPDAFSFNHITDAKIDKVYASNTVTITWLSANTQVLASVTRWALYISGEMVGTTWYVQNGWTVKIEMNSSDEYDEDVNSTLTINGVSSTFTITTMEEDEDTGNTDYDDIDTNLSKTEKLQIIAIFESLKELYAGDKEVEFFNTLMVMLEDKLNDLDEDASAYDALQYLYDLADQYNGDGWTTSTTISDASWIVNGVYTAPNGKKYTIKYDSTRKQFTSTNFLTPKYYPTLDVLKFDIDRSNPVWSKYISAKTIKARWGKVSIDGTWQTSAYTAPNRKVFYFFKTTDGQISSYTFTVEKYFDDLNSAKEYIHNSNLK